MYSIGSIQSVHCGPTVGGYVILVGLQELVDDGLRMLKGTFQEHCSKMFHSILCDPVDLGNSSCLAFATFHSNLFGSVMYGNVNSLSRSLKNHQEFKPNMLPHFISVHVRSCPYSDNAGSEKNTNFKLLFIYGWYIFRERTGIFPLTGSTTRGYILILIN